MKINEIFYSVQSEGFNAGKPADFIRLQGCSVGCAWCDTKHSWDKTKGIELSELEVIGKLQSNFVILTGGEPLEQDLTVLLDKLKTAGKYIAVETSGTELLQNGFDWITCSPKNFNKPLLDSVLSAANELKFVYTNESSEEFIFSCILKAATDLIYIQPNGISKKSTRMAVDFVKKHNFRLSVQTHKYIGIE